MHQETFKSNVFITIILPALIFGLLMLVFYAIYSVDGALPLWVLIFLIIPTAFAVSGQRTKLMVEDDMLRYQHGFIVTSNDEVSLNEVSKIVTRTVDTWEDDGEGGQKHKTQKVTYVLDESGRTFFSFSARLIDGRNRRRFKETVATINANIKVD